MLKGRMKWPGIRFLDRALGVSFGFFPSENPALLEASKPRLWLLNYEQCHFELGPKHLVRHIDQDWDIRHKAYKNDERHRAIRRWGLQECALYLPSKFSDLLTPKHTLHLDHFEIAPCFPPLILKEYALKTFLRFPKRKQCIRRASIHRAPGGPKRGAHEYRRWFSG